MVKQYCINTLCHRYSIFTLQQHHFPLGTSSVSAFLSTTTRGNWLVVSATWGQGSIIDDQAWPPKCCLPYMISRKQPNSDRRPVHGGSPGSNVRPPAAAFYHAGCAAHLLRPELILGTGICFAASAAPLIIAPWPCRASPGRGAATTVYDC